ncbi:hypothetical protein OK016_16945 [Vibrio chagasii]|nr:hypothetical protein [Vibrio chagasii]
MMTNQRYWEHAVDQTSLRHKLDNTAAYWMRHAGVMHRELQPRFYGAMKELFSELVNTTRAKS